MQLKDNFKSWSHIIDAKELKQVTSILDKEYKKEEIYPKQIDVFNAFKYCNYCDLKVVMVGYDPYPQKDIATGLLFANKENTLEKDLSPSLKIIKDSVLRETYPYEEVEFDNSMKYWAEQGILLLNSALTVKKDTVGSHTLLWRPFMVSLFKNLSQYDTGIIYVLFGNQAQTLEPYINDKFNYIIKEKHPAYYSRNKTNMPSDVFKKIDEICNKLYGEKIQWFKNI